MTAPLETTAPVAPRAAGGVWSAIAESLRGSHQDFTTGPIPRAILLLAVPMVLEIALESVFALTDMFFVGRLGPDAMATVGLTEAVLTLMYAVAAGLGVGATAVIARRIGEHDAEGAADAAMQAVGLGLILAVLCGLAGAVLAPRVLVLMGASPAVVTLGAHYARVMLGGGGTILMLFLLNAIFRGAGDAAIAMRVLWLANAINILLGPCLIFGVGPFPRLGVTGAAVATTIGRATGVIFALSRLLRPGGRVSIGHRPLRLHVAVMARLLRLSVSGAMQAFISMSSWIILVRIAATFGSVIVAGYAVAMRLVIFAILPSWGLSNAAATMVGQALGARLPDRAERSVWLTAWISCVVLSVVGVALIAAAPWVVGQFTADPGVQRAGVSCVRIVGAGFPLYAYGMVVTQSFNGAGDTWTPTFINLGIFWAFEIPLAYVLAGTSTFGPRGVFGAITLAFSMLAVVSVIIFRRGRWKQARV